MKTAFIIVLYQTPKDEVGRLKDEIKDLGFDNFEIYLIDNSFNNQGYATGVNEGIKKALAGNCDTVIIMNPDISLKGLTAGKIFGGSKNFDIWGLAMRQRGKIYYGGEIDKWKLSGGLRVKTPMYQFIEVDFVSGSLMIIKAQTLNKIGLFDESYFMYYEDVDYCLRAKKAGLKVGIDARNSYEHFESSSILNKKKDIQLAKSHEIFFNKYACVWQRLRKVMLGKFIFNFASLNFSSLINKFLNFILFTFLIGYLTPANYGIYVLVWAFIEFFSPFLDFGTTSYGLTYLPQEKKQNFSRLVSLRFFLMLVIFAIITPASLVFFPNQLHISFFIFLTSIVVLANMWSGSYLIITSLKEKVYQASGVSVIFNFFLISILILLLWLKRDLSLIFGAIFFCYAIYTVINWYLVKKEFFDLKIKFDFKNWMPILKKSTFFVLVGFFSGLYFKQDIFLLKYLQSDQVVGVYSAGFKFLEALLLIAGSYSMVSLPILSKLLAKKEILKLRVKRDFVLFIFIGFIVSLIFYFLSPYLLTLFLKSKYQNSLAVARIVVFSLPFVLGTTVCFSALYVLKKVKTVILIYLFQIFVNLILNLIFIPRFSLFASAYITIICEILNLVFGYYFIRKYLFYESRS